MFKSGVGEASGWAPELWTYLAGVTDAELCELRPWCSTLKHEDFGDLRSLLTRAASKAAALNRLDAVKPSRTYVDRHWKRLLDPHIPIPCEDPYKEGFKRLRRASWGTHSKRGEELADGEHAREKLLSAERQKLANELGRHVKECSSIFVGSEPSASMYAYAFPVSGSGAWLICSITCHTGWLSHVGKRFPKLF